MSNVYKSYVVFKVDDLFCAFDCLDVQEIIRDVSNVKNICRSDSFISGVINLRGEIVTVISLKEFFSMESEAEEAAIVVANCGKEHIGFMVKDIVDVIELRGDQIESSPAVPKGLEQDFIKGVFELDSELITVLNVEGLAHLEDETAASGGV